MGIIAFIILGLMAGLIAKAVLPPRATRGHRPVPRYSRRETGARRDDSVTRFPLARRGHGVFTP